VPQQPDPKQAVAANIMFFTMLGSAAMIAVLGTVLPGMLEFDDSTGLVIQCVLYAVALGDFVIAFWLRNKIRKANSPAQTSGTVQRQ